MVAVHKGRLNEKRPVQPHKVETHVGWHNRGCVWDKVATDWAGDEDWTRERKRCQTMEDKKRFVTSALRSVTHSTMRRTRNGKKNQEKTEDKVPRIRLSAGKTIHIREDGRQCSHMETLSKLWDKNTQGKLVIFKTHRSTIT